MVKLIGHRVDHNRSYLGWIHKRVDEVVAIFEDIEDARRYIKDSELKNPNNNERPFKSESLLSEFQHATIERYGDYSYPYNPEIK